MRKKNEPDFEIILEILKIFRKQFPRLPKKVSLLNLKKVEKSVVKMINISKKGIKK